MEHIGQPNQLSTDEADHRSVAKTRNGNIVGQHYEATRGSGALHKRRCVGKHVESSPTVNDEADGTVVTNV